MAADLEKYKEYVLEQRKILQDPHYKKIVSWSDGLDRIIDLSDLYCNFEEFYYLILSKRSKIVVFERDSMVESFYLEDLVKIKIKYDSIFIEKRASYTADIITLVREASPLGNDTVRFRNFFARLDKLMIAYNKAIKLAAVV